MFKIQLEFKTMMDIEMFKLEGVCQAKCYGNFFKHEGSLGDHYLVAYILQIPRNNLYWKFLYMLLDAVECL